MSQLLTWALLLVTISDPTPKPPENEVDFTLEAHEKSRTIIENYDGVDDKEATLSDVLDEIRKRYKFNISINYRAFGKKKMEEIATIPICKDTPLPKMTKVTLGAVLKAVLARISVENSQATYTVRSYGCEITTLAAQKQEFYPEGYQGEFYPLVIAQFEDTSIELAAKELSQQGTISVVIDRSELTKNTPKVTAQLINVPMDTAVILLAESVNLRAVRVGRSFFLTSPTKAKNLDKWQNSPLNFSNGFSTVPIR